MTEIIASMSMADRISAEAEENPMEEQKPVRKSISRALRFEVFKRDKFTCQYCGSKAPEVVLHADHVVPVVEGGETTLLNLVTSCLPCNLGKGPRKLGDDSAITKQQRQMEELQERRAQIEMLIEWQQSLSDLVSDQVEIVEEKFEQVTGFGLTDSGRRSVRSWLRTYPINEVLDALEIAFERHLETDNQKKVTKESASLSFSKVKNICLRERQEKDQPGIKRLAYINGILKNRFKTPRANYMESLKAYHYEWGISLDQLEDAAKTAVDFEHLNDLANDVLARRGDD